MGTYLKRSNGAITNQHVYLYHGAGQRQRQTLRDGSYTTYTYDDDGQLASGLGYYNGGSPLTSEQLTFGYDPGWNMTNRSVNGAAAAYVVSDLNQITSVPGVTYVHDANGNRTSAASGTTQTLTYDDENRLISVSYGTSYRSDFVYDGLSRMRTRTDYTWTGSSWSASGTVRLLYDGMRVVQERDGSNTPSVVYTRGNDLSGSFEGAGGIGGLLARSHGYAGGLWTAHNSYHADGGGNITCMVNNTNGVVASYKYDAFGRTISSSGPLAPANTYRFSTKEIHPNSGFYYYGYRFYDPNTQRWLNRDPIEEEGGINLYHFNFNDPIGRVDTDGRGSISGPSVPDLQPIILKRDPACLAKCNQELPLPGSSGGFSLGGIEV